MDGVHWRHLFPSRVLPLIKFTNSFIILAQNWLKFFVLSVAQFRVDSFECSFKVVFILPVNNRLDQIKDVFRKK